MARDVQALVLRQQGPGGGGSGLSWLCSAVLASTGHGMAPWTRRLALLRRPSVQKISCVCDFHHAVPKGAPLLKSARLLALLHALLVLLLLCLCLRDQGLGG
jgi:hypothetical protein